MTDLYRAWYLLLDERRRSFAGVSGSQPIGAELKRWHTTRLRSCAFLFEAATALRCVFFAGGIWDSEQSSGAGCLSENKSFGGEK
jgi:hypothetical protein